MIKSMTVVDKTARKSSGLFRKQIVFCLWDFRLSVYGSKFRTSTAATRENKSIAPTLDAGRSRKPIHTFSSFDYIKMNGIPSVFEFQRKLIRPTLSSAVKCNGYIWLFNPREHSYHGLKRMLIEFRKWGIYSTNPGYRTRQFPTRRGLSALCLPCGVAMIAPNTLVTEHLSSSQGQRVMC